MNSSQFGSFLGEVRDWIEPELAQRLQADRGPLAEAMRYAALGPGKRVRPALMLAVGRSLGLGESVLAGPAAAIEMVHAFSLVHDDLPAMDDDDLRRGRETVHIAFDEATAILAGDALLNLAFELLAKEPPSATAEQRNQAVILSSRAIGGHGLIGGQKLDINLTAKDPGAVSASALEEVHRGKTGALMRLCGELPAVYTDEDAGALGALCEDIGLMFQIRDDLLDLSQSAKTLGKTTGKDLEQGKATYPAIHGREGAIARLGELHQRTLSAVDSLAGPTKELRLLMDFVVERDH